MKKKSLIMAATGVMVLVMTLTTGCGNQEEKIKGNCHATECIKQITVDSTVEDINKIIGFDGELTDSTYNVYYWKISDKEAIKASYYSGTKATVTAEVEKESLANAKVDLSKYEQLQQKVKQGISYQEFITYIGNVDGVVTEKNSTSTKYTWVAKDGSYLTGTFSNQSNQCTFVSGRVS